LHHLSAFILYASPYTLSSLLVFSLPGEDSGGECGVPTQLRFPMPGPWRELEKDEPWYDFSTGPVHWVVLCIEKVWREEKRKGGREGGREGGKKGKIKG
jgi:hypothetical protein